MAVSQGSQRNVTELIRNTQQYLSITAESKTNKIHSSREKPLIIYNLFHTCFGPSWATIKELKVITKRSV